jgi:hypothetical protein
MMLITERVDTLLADKAHKDTNCTVYTADQKPLFLYYLKIKVNVLGLLNELLRGSEQILIGISMKNKLIKTIALEVNFKRNKHCI